MIEIIERKLKLLRKREQQAIEEKDFTKCLRLDGAIFHLENLYVDIIAASSINKKPSTEL